MRKCLTCGKESLSVRCDKCDDSTSPIVFKVTPQDPSHYKEGKIECILYMKDNMPPEAFKGYLEGCVKKYLHRWRYKNGVEDLEKSRVYLDWLIEEVRDER